MHNQKPHPSCFDPSFPITSTAGTPKKRNFGEHFHSLLFAREEIGLPAKEKPTCLLHGSDFFLA